MNRLNLSMRMKRLTLTLAAAATLAGGILATGGGGVPTTQAAPLSFHYTAPGYSLQSGWLCLDTRFSNGYTTLHCTRRYHRAGAFLVSDDPRWVPGAMRISGSGGGSSSAPAAHRPAPAVAPAPRGISQWAYTGRGSYFFFDPFAIGGNRAALSYPWGNCTWYAAFRARDNVSFLGNAGMWAGMARWRGLPTGYSPVAGATVVFQGGVQGASWLGHVAHVEAVYPGGWFLVSEMNFSWNGGGFGRVDYRYAHTGPGVSFIY